MENTENADGTQAPPASQRTVADVVTGTRRYRGIGATIARRGGTPHVRVIRIGDVMAPARVAFLLALPIGTQVLERCRVHSSDEHGRRIPMQVSTTWFPLHVADRIPVSRQVDTGDGGMIARLEGAGYRLRFEDTVVCRLPEEEEREWLGIGRDQPVTIAWRRVFDQEDKIVEAGRRVVNPLLCELTYEYP